MGVTVDQISRVIGYVRVSTDDQDDSGAGLEAQRRAIEAKVVLKGWRLVGHIRKDVASGKSINGRHELQAALGELKAHRADALVVAKLDRLSRSVTDFAALLELARKEGWYLVMLDLELDTSTPMGEAMANMAMTFAQLERRMIGQRTKEALAVKRARGVGKPGGLKAAIGRRSLVDPADVRRILSRRRAGHSFQRIAADLTRRGRPSPAGENHWRWETVRKIVRRNRTEEVKARRVAEAS